MSGSVGRRFIRPTDPAIVFLGEQAERTPLYLAATPTDAYNARVATRVLEYRLPSGQVVAVEHGDLTEAHVDAIVNAANSTLAHGGGVAGAIVRAGGPSIQDESDAWVLAHGPAGYDRPALTGAGQLPARAVIHAVGPVWRGGTDGEPAALRAAYTAALDLAQANGFQSIAFPSISTGIFGFPVSAGAAIAVEAVLDFCQAAPDSSPREIRFTLIDSATLAIFKQALAAHMLTGAEPELGSDRV